MTSKYFIGIRLTISEMKLVNGSDQFQLNSTMSNTLASVAMRLGIKKTQLGKPINFYLVSEDEIEYLTAETSKSMIPLRHSVEWLPLLKVDAGMMNETLKTVNEKYSHRMDRATHKKYSNELIEAMGPCVTKLNEDRVIDRKKPKSKRNFY